MNNNYNSKMDVNFILNYLLVLDKCYLLILSLW